MPVREQFLNRVHRFEEKAPFTTLSILRTYYLKSLTHFNTLLPLRALHRINTSLVYTTYGAI